MNPPEEPQQKSSCDHHTPPQTPPPEQGKPPGTRTDHTVVHRATRYNQNRCVSATLLKRGTKLKETVLNTF